MRPDRCDETAQLVADSRQCEARPLTDGIINAGAFLLASSSSLHAAVEIKDGTLPCVASVTEWVRVVGDTVATG